MCRHAAQHLLSAIADVVTGADTAGWELRPSSTDGAVDAVLVELETDALSPEQVCAIGESAHRPRSLIGCACWPTSNTPSGLAAQSQNIPKANTTPLRR